MTSTPPSPPSPPPPAAAAGADTAGANTAGANAAGDDNAGTDAAAADAAAADTAVADAAVADTAVADAAVADDDLPDSVPADLPGPRVVVEVLTTYLEMQARPTTPLAPPPDGVQVVHARRPTPRFYRYLYDAVGAPWHWYDRRRMPAAELAAILDDDAVEVHVLWKDGVPAGYTELDRRTPGQVELAYFGLLPEAIGQRLGPWLLAWSIHEAWRPDEVRRVWVHTCSLDHPAALRTYLAAGFATYGDQRHRQTILAP